MTAALSGTNGLLQSYDYQTPTTGFSYTFVAGTQVLVINPAGTLATGTITMPANPADGMTISFSSTQTITALTVNANAGQTINNAVNSLSAGQAVSYIYRSASTAWFPFSSDSIGSLGYGQTWQDLTASRALATTYTNTTGKPIVVNAINNENANSPRIFLTVSGILIMYDYKHAPTARGWRTTVSGIVPNGATYQVDSDNGLSVWAELR